MSAKSTVPSAWAPLAKAVRDLERDMLYKAEKYEQDERQGYIPPSGYRTYSDVDPRVAKQLAAICVDMARGLRAIAEVCEEEARQASRRERARDSG